MLAMMLDAFWKNLENRREFPHITYGLMVILGLLCLSNLWPLLGLFISQKPPAVPAATLVKIEKLPDLAQFHFFGVYENSKLDANELPQAVLNLALIGIFNAIPASAAQVVLAVPGGPQKIYKVGDVIPGNAKIYRILDNSVVIEREGQLEVLAFPQAKSIFGELPRTLSDS